MGEFPATFKPDKPKLNPFLEGKVGLETLTIGGRTSGELLQTLLKRGVRVGSYARRMIESSAFTTLAEQAQINLALIPARVLVPGENFPITEDVYRKAEELGLKKVPAEVGLHYRLAHLDQPLGEWIAMGMEPIAASGGGLRVFEVARDGQGLWLNGYWGPRDYRWGPNGGFIFGLASN